MNNPKETLQLLQKVRKDFEEIVNTPWYKECYSVSDPIGVANAYVIYAISTLELFNLIEHNT